MIAIHMVPAFATPGGLSLSRSLLPSLQTISKHLAEATECCLRDADGLQFHTDPKLLNAELFEDTARTIMAGQTVFENTRRGEPRISKYEYSFFREILKNSSGTIERLGAEALAAPTTRRFDNAWMYCDAPATKRAKARVTFDRTSPLPQFFGLALAGVAESTLRAAGIKNGLSYEKRVADQMGIGVVTALRVYEGSESLVTSRTTLLPHRAYRVEDMISRRRGDKESRRIYVASSYLPVHYSSF